MKRFYGVLVAILFCLSLFPLYSCGKKNCELYYYYFNTDVSVVSFTKGITKTEEKEIKKILDELDGEFSLEKESFLTRFNLLNVGGTMEISDIAIEVFSFIKKYNNYTKNFNPAVYPLLKLWHFTPDSTVKDADFVPPTDTEITNVLENNSFNPLAFTIDEENNLIKKSEKISFDVGGIIKGFAADKIRDILIRGGHKDGYINFGGSSIYVLKVNSMSIAHPERPYSNIVTLNMSENFSISTSGTYRTYYEYEGEIYSHIINAKSGRPSNTNVTSAVVICRDGAFADAMSTALMLYPKNEIEDFVRELSGNKSNYVYGVFVFYNDGENKEIITNEKQGDFTLLDESYSIVSVF